MTGAKMLPRTNVSKIYWTDDISEIKARYEEARQMDAADEWLKGLEGEGHSHKSDSDRMERWEVRWFTGLPYANQSNLAHRKQAAYHQTYHVSVPQSLSGNYFRKFIYIQ